MATTADWSDVLYKTNNLEDKIAIDNVLTAIVYICSTDEEYEPTEFILTVRRCIRQFVRNCLYYVTNICDLAQTNPNMCFHFNNETPSEVIEAYTSSSGSGGLGQIMKRLLAKEEEEGTDHLVYPCLYNLFRYVEPFNRRYLAKTYTAYLAEEGEREEGPVNRLDFNYVVVYLMLHGRLQLSAEMVSSFIWNKFHPIDHLFDTMQSVVIVNKML